MFTKIAIAVLAVLAGTGWSTASAAIRAGVRLQGERDAARKAGDRFGQLPDDDGVFVRVNAETLRSVVDYAYLHWLSSEQADPDLDGEINYLRERLRSTDTTRRLVPDPTRPASVFEEAYLTGHVGHMIDWTIEGREARGKCSCGSTFVTTPRWGTEPQGDAPGAGASVTLTLRDGQLP